MTGPNSVAKPIPIEPFSVNKDMGRILIRRGGETIAAGELDGASFRSFVRRRLRLRAMLVRFCGNVLMIPSTGIVVQLL